MASSENQCETVILPLIVIQLNNKNRYIQKIYVSVSVQFILNWAKWNKICCVLSNDLTNRDYKTNVDLNFIICTRFFLFVGHFLPIKLYRRSLFSVRI